MKALHAGRRIWFSYQLQHFQGWGEKNNLKFPHNSKLENLRFLIYPNLKNQYGCLTQNKTNKKIIYFGN